MIIYDLVCDQDHRFEGWFASAAEFDRQAQGKLVECPLCGSSETRRIASAAYVHTSPGPPPAPAPERAEAFYGPGTHREMSGEILAKMVRHILDSTEDVGNEFPEAARRIHYKEVPERAIRGTATMEEFDELREEGISVAALPFPLAGRGKAH